MFVCFWGVWYLGLGLNLKSHRFGAYLRSSHLMLLAEKNLLDRHQVLQVDFFFMVGLPCLSILDLLESYAGYSDFCWILLRFHDLCLICPHEYLRVAQL